MWIHLIVVLVWTALTFFVCRDMNGTKEAMIGLWKVFMVITTVASWIILILLWFKVIS